MQFSFLINSLFFISILLFSIGCGKKENTAVDYPLNILSEEKITKVIADFALAESAYNLNINSAKIQKLDSVYAFNPLIENGVRKSQYDSTLLFYSNHAGLYKKIIDKVLIYLSKMEAEKRGKIKDSTLKNK